MFEDITIILQITSPELCWGGVQKNVKSFLTKTQCLGCKSTTEPDA